MPALTRFDDVADPTRYAPLPDDWVLGLSDVVASTEAIRAGRYKAVNMAGAAVISAVSNALGTLDFPYVFAGDGMCYAVHAEEAAAARDALATSIAWVGDDLQLTLRGGTVRVGALREAGHDLRAARFAASSDVQYAMFSGGGVSWAETALKVGFLDPVHPDRSRRPDLSGLSCRFRPVEARHGLILSLIVSPRFGADARRFQALVSDVLRFIDASGEVSLPIRVESLPLPWPPQGLREEARLRRSEGESLPASLVRTGAYTLMSAAIMLTGLTVGRFSPKAYRQQIVANSDHRKFEDRLMMTLDCSPAVADALETMLDEARRAGIADHGSHRQQTALITCIVPSPTSPNHVHFIDGAAGGYALAAADLKRNEGQAAA